MNLGIALDGQAAFCKEFCIAIIAIITVARIDCISFFVACIFADRFDFSAVQNHRSHRGDGGPIFTLCINFNIVERQAVPDIYTVILTDCLQLAAGHFHCTVRADAKVAAACINVSIGNAQLSPCKNTNVGCRLCFDAAAADLDSIFCIECRIIRLQHKFRVFDVGCSRDRTIVISAHVNRVALLSGRLQIHLGGGVNGQVIAIDAAVQTLGLHGSAIFNADASVESDRAAVHGSDVNIRSNREVISALADTGNALIVCRCDLQRTGAGNLEIMCSNAALTFKEIFPHQNKVQQRIRVIKINYPVPAGVLNIHTIQGQRMGLGIVTYGPSAEFLLRNVCFRVKRVVANLQCTVLFAQHAHRAFGSGAQLHQRIGALSQRRNGKGEHHASGQRRRYCTPDKFALFHGTTSFFPSHFYGGGVYITVS